MAEAKVATKRTKLTDLDEDALVQCASYLRMKDIGSLSLTCKYFNRVCYSDSIWLRYFREHWPYVNFPNSGVREAYFSRQTAVRKLGFSNPCNAFYRLDGRPIDHVVMDKENLVFSQGNLIKTMRIDSSTTMPSLGTCTNMRGHNARITCMRLFPFSKTRDESLWGEKLLVTSSFDHSIRLWWKGSCQRCFRGHNGPVLTLSDELLGDDSTKLLASGGEDGTVRLWSLGSTRKSSQQALKATLHGHEKPIKFISVAKHRPSLLATMSMDSKVRVWDASASPSSRSTCCVGMTSVPGAPVNFKCHESLLYLASSNSVTAIDLRTMQKAFILQLGQTKICSFDMMPSKYSICTGINCKALLWDIRQTQKTQKPKLVAELDGHKGQVTLLHMDHYKVVTSSPEDANIHVWDADTGTQTNSMARDDWGSTTRYSAMAVFGTRMVNAFYVDEHPGLQYRSFFYATSPVYRQDDGCVSKFWHPHSHSESETESQD